MSASVALLEEKHRRAMLFGEFLEQHPVLSDSVVGKELSRCTSYYRIALANAIREIHVPTPTKRTGK